MICQPPIILEVNNSEKFEFNGQAFRPVDSNDSDVRFDGGSEEKERIDRVDQQQLFDVTAVIRQRVEFQFFHENYQFRWNEPGQRTDHSTVGRNAHSTGLATCSQQLYTSHTCIIPITNP